MKKLFCMILILALALSMIPVCAAASENTEQTATVTVAIYYGNSYIDYYTVTVGSDPVTLPNRGYRQYAGNTYEFAYYSKGKDILTIPAYDGTSAWLQRWANLAEYYVLHTHDYRQVYNRLHHWMACRCGRTYGKAPHTDPATLKEKICYCGYHFSNNCDLTTLWLKNMTLTQRFNRQTTDYTANVFTYKEVSKTSITATPFDALATVELPDNLEIQDGRTVFEITVTAEDRETTKTYTVTAIKPVKVAGVLINIGEDTISAEVKTKRKSKVATATIPDLLLEEMIELADKNQSTKIELSPNFNKWSIRQIDIPLPTAQLNILAADTKADLIISTHFGNVTIPNADLSALAENGSTLTISIVKEESIELFVDSEALTQIPKSIDRDLY